MSPGRPLALCSIALLALGLPLAARAAPKFVTAPTLPPLPGVTLNAGAQSNQATMNGFSVEEGALEAAGWNVTVAGQSGAEKSPVFARYCPTTCGSDTKGYVSGGATLAANSLTLNTTGASFTGGVGTAPEFQCSSACNVDSASAVKIVSKAAGGVGASTWTATGFSATSLTLSTPSTLRVLPTGEVYRVNVLWTLGTGP